MTSSDKPQGQIVQKRTDVSSPGPKDGWNRYVLTDGTTQNPDNVEKLTLSVVDICKPQSCSPELIASGLLRLAKRLLLMTISGTGEPEISWANPASTNPLRLHAFASFLNVCNAVSTLFVNSGVTQLDGKSRWNLAMTARLVALFCGEEEDIIDGTCKDSDMREQFDVEALLRPNPSNGREEGISKKRHFRSNSDNLIFSSDLGLADSSNPLLPDLTLGITGNNSGSGAGGVDALRSRRFSDTTTKLSDGDMLTASFDDLVSKWVGNNQLDDPQTESLSTNMDATTLPMQAMTMSAASVNPDTKEDFQKNLLGNSAELGDDSIGSFGAALSGVGGMGLGRRKYMTLPSSALATIKEDFDGDDNEGGAVDEKKPAFRSVGTPPPKATDTSEKLSSPLDTEMVLRPGKGHVKQMRRPQLQRNSSADDALPSTPRQEPRDVSSPKSAGGTMTDAEIETAGAAFLDAIGKDMGFG